MASSTLVNGPQDVGPHLHNGQELVGPFGENSSYPQL